NGNQQSVSGFTATGLVGSDTAANISGFTASGAIGTNAGTYTNTVSGSNSNYSNIIFTNGTLNIDRAIATINATKTYDSTTTLNGGQISITGVNGQTLNYTGTASANNANVAANGSNYVSGITGLSDGTGLASNYILPIQGKSSLNNIVNIHPASLAIIANSVSKIEGETITVSGFTSTGLQGRDSLDSVIVKSDGVDPSATQGFYTITASGAQGSRFDASNYNINYVSGRLDVLPVPEAPAPTVIPFVGQKQTASPTVNFNDFISVKAFTPLALSHASPFVFTLPPDTFVFSNRKINLVFEAHLATGESLPKWLKFDGTTGTFKGIPTTEVKNIDVVVTAHDGSGAQAQTKIALVFDKT
ncbi:MBG domain-containing protein, partial [Undibacterium sp. MH2W]|uniref:MBG domain-containing protein n=1 Tax=Undibacterium sp. MH2W TaxID=3413044 RepID=UPI003BF108C0